MMKNYIAVGVVAAAIILILAVCPVSAVPVNLPVSVPVQITSDSHYERNPSVLEADNGMWWLFYTRGRDDRGVRSNDYNPDLDYYDIYYRVARTKEGLMTAQDHKVPGNYPDNAQRDVSAIKTGDGTIWVFTSTGLGPGVDRSAYYYRYDRSGWSGPVIVPGTNYAAHVNAVTDGDKIFIFYDVGYNLNVTVYRNQQWSDPVLVTTDATIGKGLSDRGVLYVVWSHIVESDNVWGDWIGLSVSHDKGLSWQSYDRIAAWPGATNWDPALIKGTKVFKLFFAPDTGNGGQFIAMSSSNNPVDTASWSVPIRVTTAQYGLNSWWDFWPDPLGIAEGHTTVVDLFYTSERNRAGTKMTDANIWMMRVIPSIGGNELNR